MEFVLSSSFVPAIWIFSMCFALPMNAVDIISAIEFDKTGEHLATGDRGGRVVLFERTDGREVCSVHSSSLRTASLFDIEGYI